MSCREELKNNFLFCVVLQRANVIYVYLHPLHMLIYIHVFVYINEYMHRCIYI